MTCAMPNGKLYYKGVISIDLATCIKVTANLLMRSMIMLSYQSPEQSQYMIIPVPTRKHMHVTQRYIKALCKTDRTTPGH